MKRLNIQSLTTLVLFGIIFAACGPAPSARADDPPNIVFVDPTNNATVNVGPLSSKLKVNFKTHNGFNPLLVEVRLRGRPRTNPHCQSVPHFDVTLPRLRLMV